MHILILLVLTSGVFAAEAKEFRAAWLEFVQPVIEPERFSSAFHYHRAREKAIEVILPAAQTKKDWGALESLGYFYLRDFKYRSAQEQFEAALKRNSREPRLYYLLGQAKAVLLLAEPQTRSEECKEAIKEFRKAAERDAGNAMPLLQAASVTFDSDRADLALPLVSDALQKPEYRFYTLPVPEDLVEDSALAAAAWWWVQSELWRDMINRTTNCGRGMIRQADRLALSGEKDKAEELYHQAAEIGRLLCRAEPRLCEALSAGLELEREALRAQSAGRTGGSTAGSVRIKQIESAQQELKRLWSNLQKNERQQPPASVQERQDNQKRLVEAILSSL